MIYEYKFELNVDPNNVVCVPVEHLLKIRCRETEMERIKNDPYATKDYRLSFKRVNRWWWDVTFIDKECDDFDEFYKMKG